MKNYTRIDKVWDYIIIYMLLLFKAGFMFYELYSAVSSLLLLIVGLGLLHSRKSIILKKHVNIIVVIFLCQLLTYIFCGFPSENKMALGVINLITPLFIVSLIPHDKFSRYFSDIILVICIVSLIGHILFISGLPLINNLPIITNSNGHSVYFALFAEFWMDAYSGVYRLQGIFWEPGAFQTMIIIAALFDMYKNAPPKKYFRYICYALSLVFTYSTTGYICILFFITLMVLKGRRINFSKILQLCIMLSLLFVVVMKLIKSFDGFLYYSTIGKLEMVYNSFNFGESNDASSRVESVIFPLMYFLESPIWGVGEIGFENLSFKIGHNMFTCTPVNYLANYGILCAVICYVGFLKYLRLNNKSFIEGFVLISLLLTTTSSENFAFNPILTCFILYGYSLGKFNKYIA